MLGISHLWSERLDITVIIVTNMHVNWVSFWLRYWFCHCFPVKSRTFEGTLPERSVSCPFSSFVTKICPVHTIKINEIVIGRLWTSLKASMILCVSNIYCEAEELSRESCKLQAGRGRGGFTNPNLYNTLWEQLSNAEFCFVCFWRWLGIFCICSGPKHQDAIHFWMPELSMICVSWDNASPWEADRVKGPERL